MYEKSIRAPIGKDWNSIGVYQKMITPKVQVRKGAMIEPIQEMKKKGEEEDEKRLGEKQRTKQKKMFNKRKPAGGLST